MGNVMTIALDNMNNENVYKKCFYPDDINDKQTFPLDATDLTTDMPNSQTIATVQKISITFEKSSDFFGRIIIYHLELFN